MGAPTPVILKVETPEYKKLVIEGSDGNRYFTDLSSFLKVYCFPGDKSEWDKVSTDSYGLSLVWASRFEVHMDQVVALAYKTEKIANRSA